MAACRAAALGWLACGLALGGCAAPGVLELTSLDFTRIEPPAAKVQRLELSQCWWWADEAGTLRIAGEHTSTVFPGAPPLVVRISLELERLPAGAAREYKVNSDTLRGVARLGPLETQLTSQRGIVAVYRESGNRLRVVMRVRATGEALSLLGAGRTSSVLLLATLHARQDAEKAATLFDLTDS